MSESSQNPFFFAPSGILRIRWWVPAVLGAIWVSYIMYNLLYLLMLMAGGKGHLDPFWHALIIWVFE